MNPFECTTRFTYRGVKPDLTVGLPALISGVLEASLQHTESTPHPMAWYTENNMGFLLTNWQVLVERYPKWGDEIHLRTWPTLFKGVLAERTFEAFGKDGGRLLRANSGWVFTDLIRRRPLRPAAALLEGYGPPAPPSLEKDYALPNRAGLTPIDSRELTVARRDTDANGHANNVSYIEWALEAIPDGVYDNFNVTEMKTAYKKECARGARVLAETFALPENGSGGGRAFAVLLKDRGQNDALLCETYFRFG